MPHEARRSGKSLVPSQMLAESLRSRRWASVFSQAFPLACNMVQSEKSSSSLPVSCLNAETDSYGLRHSQRQLVVRANLHQLTEARSHNWVSKSHSGCLQLAFADAPERELHARPMRQLRDAHDLKWCCQLSELEAEGLIVRL